VWNQPTLDLVNSTISGNRAQEHGGGIFARQLPAITLANTTITDNTADADGGGTPGDGGGVHLEPGFSGTFALRNSILAGNVDPTSDPDCFGPVSSLGNNLIGQVSAGCGFTPTTGDQTGTPASPLNPRLGPLANNGGPTQTHALLKGSPAIGAADPDTTEPKDQRGLRRKDPDAGAYELVFCAKVPVNRIGTSGKDKLRGTNKADGMLGLGGKDTLIGKGGKDGLCGGPGKDLLKGGGGKDRLKGQGGKDVCIGGPGKDRATTCEREKSI
jgi:Ca2+-binding RTX toxin-like protein